MFGDLDRPGIPRIIPQPVKASQVQIGAIDEEAEDLVKNRLKREPLTTLSQKRKPSRKQCGYPGCLKVSGYQCESGAAGQLVGCSLTGIAAILIMDDRQEAVTGNNL